MSKLEYGGKALGGVQREQVVDRVEEADTLLIYPSLDEGLLMPSINLANLGFGGSGEAQVAASSIAESTSSVGRRWSGIRSIGLQSMRY